MDSKPEDIRNSLKHEFGRLFFIGVGIFLFILFFQPFPLDTLDYNDRLLYVTGFGAISFVLGCVVLILLPILAPKWFKISEWESGPILILNVLLLLFTATAFAFYIRFVGKTYLSLYILFKIVLVCLLPLIILIILYKNKSLERIIEILQDQHKLSILQLKEFEQSSEDEKIEIVSDNKADKLILKYRNIVSVKSADNYIEIYYLEKNEIEKKLIRNTLKNVEIQLAHHKNFIRCHRTSIVNVMYIEKLVRTLSGYSLKMTYFKEEIPVSRQYIMHIKEAISVFE